MKKDDSLERLVTNDANQLYVSGIPLHKEIEIDALFSVLYLKYTKNYVFNGEKHNFWEMVYVDSGEVTIESDGDTYVLTQSQFFLHAPNEFHKIRANDQACNTTIITFACSSNRLDLLTKEVQTASKFQKQLLTAALNDVKKVMATRCDYFGQFKEAPTTTDEQAVKNALELFFLYVLKSGGGGGGKG